MLSREPDTVVVSRPSNHNDDLIYEKDSSKTVLCSEKFPVGEKSVQPFANMMWHLENGFDVELYA